MAQIVAQEIYVGAGASPDIEIGNYDVILTSAQTFSASGAASFDFVNRGGSGVIIYSSATGIPPGSGSCNYVLSLFAVPPVGSAGGTGTLLVASTGSNSAAGTTVLMCGQGINATPGAVIARENKLVPRNCRVTVSFSAAAASVTAILAIGVSFIK